MRLRGTGTLPGGATEAELADALAKGELMQMPDESDRQYAVFMAYCKNGESSTFEDIAKAQGGTQAWVSRLKREKKWDERIMDWQMNRKERGITTTADIVWSEKKNELRRQEWEAHNRVVVLCNQFLDRWKDSEDVPRLGEIAKMLEIASRLGRMAAGLPLSYTEEEQAPPTFRIDIEAALARAYGRPQKPAVVTEPEPAALTEQNPEIVTEEVPGELPEGSREGAERVPEPTVVEEQTAQEVSPGIGD